MCHGGLCVGCGEKNVTGTQQEEMNGCDWTMEKAPIEVLLHRHSIGINNHMAPYDTWPSPDSPDWLEGMLSTAGTQHWLVHFLPFHCFLSPATTTTPTTMIIIVLLTTTVTKCMAWLDDETANAAANTFPLEKKDS